MLPFWLHLQSNKSNIRQPRKTISGDPTQEVKQVGGLATRMTYARRQSVRCCCNQTGDVESDHWDSNSGLFSSSIQTRLLGSRLSVRPTVTYSLIQFDWSALKGVNGCAFSAFLAKPKMNFKISVVRQRLTCKPPRRFHECQHGLRYQRWRRCYVGQRWCTPKIQRHNLQGGLGA